MEKKSFRVRTNTDGKDNHIMVKLDQSYDCLEILSLKLAQDKIYRSFTSDYGVLVGRVIANEGLGIPNAKVSVFIPISEEDKDNLLISDIYPYETISDKDNAGVKYNLLTESEKSPVGTFPKKQQILDNNVLLEIYEKYYKFSTVTNDSGDYMIFGLPVGQQTIHMDVDLSDIGKFSYTADMMVANGLPTNLFIENDKTYTFAGGVDFEKLPQIQSQNLSVDVIPLWGDAQIEEIGITRLDFKINIFVDPVAFLTFSVGMDDDRESSGLYNGDDINIGESFDTFHMRVPNDRRPGGIHRMATKFQFHDEKGNFTLQNLEIKAYKTIDGEELMYDSTAFKVIQQKSLINGGVFIILLPCNDNKVVTDEFGNLIPSTNGKGIGTTGTWRVELLTNKFDRYRHIEIPTFETKAGDVYTTKLKLFDRYRLRDFNDRNIFKNNNDRPIMYADSWLNGFMYFGAGYFDGGNRDTEKSRPNWLMKDGDFYNLQIETMNVTEFLDEINSRTNTYPQLNVAVFSSSEIPIGLNAGLSRGYLGDNVYVFIKGLKQGGDCFSEIKKYKG